MGLLNMNKSDIKLIILLTVIIITSLSISFFIKDNSSKIANVYYEKKLVLSIDLSDYTNRFYEVNGYNGVVKLEVANGKIRVIEENSPLHLCSKSGFIESSLETIICLPNKIVVEIDSKRKDDLDVIIK